MHQHLIAAAQAAQSSGNPRDIIAVVAFVVVFLGLVVINPLGKSRS